MGLKTLLAASLNENYVTGNHFLFSEVGGFAAASFQITGTFTSGAFTPQVSNDGSTWVATVAYAADGTKKTTLTAVGMYRVDVNGFKMVRLSAASVVGSLSINAQASESTLYINA